MVFSPVYQENLCDDPNLDKLVWMTQARKLKYTHTYYDIFISCLSNNLCILIFVFSLSLILKRIFFNCAIITIEY